MVSYQFRTGTSRYFKTRTLRSKHLDNMLSSQEQASEMMRVAIAWAQLSDFTDAKRHVLHATMTTNSFRRMGSFMDMMKMECSLQDKPSQARGSWRRGLGLVSIHLVWRTAQHQLDC